MSSDKNVYKLLDGVDGTTEGLPFPLNVGDNTNGGKMCLMIVGINDATIVIQGQIVPDGDSIVAGYWVDCYAGGVALTNGCYNFDVSPTHVRAVTTLGTETTEIKVWLA